MKPDLKRSKNVGLGALIYIYMTKNRLMVAFDSNKGPNLKVVKWC